MKTAIGCAASPCGRLGDNRRHAEIQRWSMLGWPILTATGLEYSVCWLENCIIFSLPKRSKNQNRNPNSLNGKRKP